MLLYVTVEEVVLAAGEQAGYDKQGFTSRMNEALAVF